LDSLKAEIPKVRWNFRVLQEANSAEDSKWRKFGIVSDVKWEGVCKLIHMNALRDILCECNA
jgi:hypothetical protein